MAATAAPSVATVAVRILKENRRSKFKKVYVIIRARVNWEYASSVIFTCADKLRSHALIPMRSDVILLEFLISIGGFVLHVILLDLESPVILALLAQNFPC